MVVIRNIEKNGEIVEFDYYPENEKENGHIKYNYETKSIISQIKSEYDLAMDYAGHSIIAVERVIEQNKEFPTELVEMWY